MKIRTDDYLFSSAYINSLKTPISDSRSELFEMMRKICPNPHITEFFELKYTYNTLKSLIRKNATLKEDFSKYKDEFSYARDILAKTQSPQLSDIFLDRMYFKRLLSTAEASKSSFLYGYAKLLIDSSNLLSFCRAKSQGKESALLSDLFFQGGNLSLERVKSLAESRSPGDMAGYCNSFLEEYLQSAKYIPFGPEPIILFLSKQV